MKIAIRNLDFSLYIGDLPWEKTHLQKVSVDVEIQVKRKASTLSAVEGPDYWAVSKGILKEYSKSHYEWVEDLAEAMARYLKRNFGIKGRLIVRKFPKVAQSPKVFEVELPI